MLLSQITNPKLGFNPSIRHKTEFITVTLIIFSNGWQLEKVPCDNDLNPTESFIAFLEIFQHLIDQIELLGMQHRNFINDQDLRIFQVFFQVFTLFHPLQVFFRQKVFDSYSGPGMNGHTIHMRCRNTSRCSNGD